MSTENTYKELVYIAKSLGIQPYRRKHKSKRLLLKEINTPSNRCYNKNDPVTLENIDDLPFDKRIEWEQIDRKFCMSVDSLHGMLVANNTLLPWACDFASGIEQSKNPEEYDKNYNMKNVEGLEEKIHTLYVPPTEPNVERISPYTFERFRFERNVEKLREFETNQNGQEMYVSHIIDFFYNKHPILGRNVMIESLMKLDVHYYEYLSLRIFINNCLMHIRYTLGYDNLSCIRNLNKIIESSYSNMEESLSSSFVRLLIFEVDTVIQRILQDPN